MTGADRRLAGRLTLGLGAAIGLGVPVLLLALLVRSSWSPLIELDTDVADGLHTVAVQHGWWVDLMKTISTVGDPTVFRVITTVAALALWRADRRRLAAWTVVTMWGSTLLGILLKEIVGRTRPDLLDAVATAPGRSFPSGHALGSTVGCAVLLLLVLPMLSRPWKGVAIGVAVVIPLLVGFSRIALGVHYLSDVVAGEVLGVAWVAGTAALFHLWRREVGAPPAPAAELEPELAEDAPEPS